MPKCLVCVEAILDKFVLKVEDNYFHIHCLKCKECDVKLTEKCFSRDGVVYCREDFFKYALFYRLNYTYYGVI